MRITKLWANYFVLGGENSLTALQNELRSLHI